MIDDINIANLPGIGSIPQIAVPNEVPEEPPHPADVTAVPSSGIGSGATIGSGPIGQLSPEECQLFRGVVEKFFPEETLSAPLSLLRAETLRQF